MGVFALQGRKCVLVTDTGVAAALGSLLKDCFRDVPVLAISAGETSKSTATLEQAWEFLAAQRCDRRSVLWVLGGGVVGDLGGFAAATYLRGIDYVQVPTTLLAMVDSSVGGKTGLNLRSGKNLAGAFHHPVAVHVFPALLRTLPAREFNAGAAEVIKYGLLGDPALVAQLEESPLTPAHPGLAAIIRRCCELKAGIVQADERELAVEGGRALLNLGHTFGHAIEQVAGYGAYLHGEAVAIGLHGAARLSRALGLVGDDLVTRIERIVSAHQLPVRLRQPLPIGALREAMSRDKKNRDQALRFVVLEAAGKAATRSGIAPALVEQIWRELGAIE
ncbi:MAG: 3-dehydroquinate synthase [Candidatus Didemnitutus sp.]|nr:3-dehydroquinate synthase [Candidatus Didemnitutus sp.]